MDLDRALAFSRYADAGLRRVARAARRNRRRAGRTVRLDRRGRRSSTIASTTGDPVALATALRRLRRRVFVHALVRDLTGRATLAEVCGTSARWPSSRCPPPSRCTRARSTAAHGRPIGEETGTRAGSSSSSAWASSAARELNVSSDIDLVFVYPEDGETDGAARISNREFFDRLGQRVIAALSRGRPPTASCSASTCGCAPTAKAAR